MLAVAIRLKNLPKPRLCLRLRPVEAPDDIVTIEDDIVIGGPRRVIVVCADLKQGHGWQSARPRSVPARSVRAMILRGADVSTGAFGGSAPASIC